MVLYAQLDRLKGEKIAELKAAGVEYDERMEELEKLEYPKPQPRLHLRHLQRLRREAPLGGRRRTSGPSRSRARCTSASCRSTTTCASTGCSAARACCCATCRDVYKALVQTVPERCRNRGASTTSSTVCARWCARWTPSLLDEWERMRNPGEAAIAPKPWWSRKPQGAHGGPRAFAARVRDELHRLLRALAQRRYLDALAHAGRDEGWASGRRRSWSRRWRRTSRSTRWWCSRPQARRPANTFLKEAGTAAVGGPAAHPGPRGPRRLDARLRDRPDRPQGGRRPASSSCGASAPEGLTLRKSRSGGRGSAPG